MLSNIKVKRKHFKKRIINKLTFRVVLLCSSQLDCDVLNILPKMEHLFLGYRTGPDIFRIVCTTSSFAFVAVSLSLSLALSLLSQPTLICFVWVMAIPPRKPLGKSSQGCSWSPWNKVSIFPCSPKLKSWLSIFLVPPMAQLSEHLLDREVVGSIPYKGYKDLSATLYPCVNQ